MKQLQEQIEIHDTGLWLAWWLGLGCKYVQLLEEQDIYYFIVAVLRYVYIVYRETGP